MSTCRESLFAEYTKVSVSCVRVYASSPSAKTRSSERSDLPSRRFDFDILKYRQPPCNLAVHVSTYSSAAAVDYPISRLPLSSDRERN